MVIDESIEYRSESQNLFLLYLNLANNVWHFSFSEIEDSFMVQEMNQILCSMNKTSHCSWVEILVAVFSDWYWIRNQISKVKLHSNIQGWQKTHGWHYPRKFRSLRKIPTMTSPSESPKFMEIPWAMSPSEIPKLTEIPLGGITLGIPQRVNWKYFSRLYWIVPIACFCSADVSESLEVSNHRLSG